MAKDNIILTGFMGTGKTSVGKRLANLLGYEFIDTDHLIESRLGMTIAELFRIRGEAEFRRIEAELARELAQRRGLVIATGGRMMLDPANAAALGKTGQIFCLVAKPEEILQRVSGDSQVRPLLQGSKPLEQITALLAQREEGYQRFLQYDTSDKSPAAIAGELAEMIQGVRDV